MLRIVDETRPAGYAGVSVARDRTSGGCTTGFGVHDQSGAGYLLTAHHCFPRSGKQVVVTPGNPSVVIGQITSEGIENTEEDSVGKNGEKNSDWHPDLTLIETPRAGYKVYVGGYNAHDTKNVTGVGGRGDCPKDLPKPEHVGCASEVHFYDLEPNMPPGYAINVPPAPSAPVPRPGGSPNRPS